MKKIIHVDQHAIRAGRANPISVKTYKDNKKVRGVEISGPCRIVYSPDKPLACGARVWIETHAEVLLMETT